MRFKRSYLEVLVDDGHISDVEENLVKGELFAARFNPENTIAQQLSSSWMEQLTIMMLSKKSTEEQKDRCYAAQQLIIDKNDVNESESEKIKRSIPKVVKDAVRKKYNDKCAACKSPHHLHFHHIIKFSEGGPHSVDNLMLLCHYCHAEEHKGEGGGALLRGKLSTIKNDTNDSAWDYR